MNRTTTLPLRIDGITAEWLTSASVGKYPGTVVTEVFAGAVIIGSATNARLLLFYDQSDHVHHLPPTRIKGGFIRHDFTYDRAFMLGV